jgi:hypothetical protein
MIFYCLGNGQLEIGWKCPLKYSLVLHILNMQVFHLQDDVAGFQDDTHRLMLTVQKELKPLPVSHVEHGPGIQTKTARR